MQRPMLVIFLAIFTGCQAQDGKREPVKQLDLLRYSGKWYEIARYPHRFERDLCGVSATYILRPDGKIGVLNAGFRGSLNGEYTQATAIAKPADKQIQGKLKVYFVPFFGAAYWVLDVDPDYQWAIVGSRSMKYLWILSRTPQMDNSLYDKLIDKVTKMGYQPDKLIKVEQ